MEILFALYAAIGTAWWLISAINMFRSFKTGIVHDDGVITKDEISRSQELLDRVIWKINRMPAAVSSMILAISFLAVLPIFVLTWPFDLLKAIKTKIMK